MSEFENRPPGRQIGQGMLVACFVLVLGGMTFFFDGFLQNQANPNQNPDSFERGNGLREVILQQNRQGHYVVNGTINGLTVTFLLDTGATDVAIPAAVAERARLARGSRSQATTANGVINVYSTSIDELVIGNIRLQDINASITSNMPGDTILLGMSALRQVEFTQRGETLTLRQLASN